MIANLNLNCMIYTFHSFEYHLLILFSSWIVTLAFPYPIGAWSIFKFTGYNQYYAPGTWPIERLARLNNIVLYLNIAEGGVNRQVTRNSRGRMWRGNGGISIGLSGWHFLCRSHICFVPGLLLSSSIILPKCFCRPYHCFSTLLVHTLQHPKIDSANHHGESAQRWWWHSSTTFCHCHSYWHVQWLLL